MYVHLALGLPSNLQFCCYHNQDALPSADQMEEGHCRVSQDRTEEHRKFGLDGQRIWLVNWEPTWEAAKMIRFNPNNVKWLETLRQALCPPLA